MDADNSGNSSDEAVGGQTASARMNSDEVRDAAQELQANVSRFFQEDQRADEDLSRLMDQPSDQIRRLERKIEDVRSATERNRELIRNYRQ